MMALVHASPKTLAPYRTDALGVLCSPRCVYGDDIQGWPWAADNDAYSRWDEPRYRSMLSRITGRQGCLFVTCPDVVADAGETMRLFSRWYDDVRATGQPVALVAQDGLTDPPWGDFDVLFLGGTTGWKLGDDARRLTAEAKHRGKHVHMGRCNSFRRMRYAEWIGCDSFDGTSLSWYRDTRLPPTLRALAQVPLFTALSGALAE